MNVLLVSSRFPWPAYTGDRLRTTVWLDALRSKARVTLVTPPGIIPPEYHHVGHIEARRAVVPLLKAAAATAMRGLPLHALIAAGFDWNSAIRHAETQSGPFDTAVVILTRLHPWVRSGLRANRVFLDAVDSSAAGAAERARASRGPARVFWSMESGRSAALERRIAARYDRVLVVSEAEASIFGPGAEVVSNGIAINPLPDHARSYDCAFWGRLGFYANHRAAMNLLQEIWPRIRANSPGATLLIAGADVPSSITRFHGQDGVEVRSPVADLRSLICRAKIAIFPVQFGTGQATKVLEAAEAACALVATPEAVRGLGPLAAEAMVRKNLGELARGVVELLRDAERIRSIGARLREAVQRHYSRDRTLERLAQLVFMT